MGDFTLVNSAAMQQGIGALSKAHRGLVSALDTLTGQLQTNLAEWDGGAREAYSVAKAEWDQSANKCGEIVGKMTTVLGSIAEGYDTNERNVQNRWSR